MKNKLFILLLVLLVFTPITASVPVVASDFERSLEPMKLGDVFAKLGEGQTLTSAEIEFLRLQMNNVQSTTAITSGWIGPDNNPRFTNMYSEMVNFAILPNNGSSFIQYGSTQVVATGTSTPVDFTTYRYYGADSLVIPYGTGTDKYQINPAFSNIPTTSFLMTASLSVGGQTSGFHSLVVYWYKKSDDSYIATAALGVSDNTSGWVGLSFAATFSTELIAYFTALAGGDVYFKVVLYQASGENVTIGTADFSVIRLR